MRLRKKKQKDQNRRLVTPRIGLHRISVFAGLLGFCPGLAALLPRSAIAAADRREPGRLYQAVVHKYYVDELYATLFVKPLIAGSALILWHGIDQDVIDATLDNSAAWRE